MMKRAKFAIEFEIDLDGVPGFGHHPQDWADYVARQLLTNSHYNPSLKIDGAQIVPSAHARKMHEKYGDSLFEPHLVPVSVG